MTENELLSITADTLRKGDFTASTVIGALLTGLNVIASGELPEKEVRRYAEIVLDMARTYATKG